MSTDLPAPGRSRIAAARERAQKAKAVLVVSALLAFLGAIVAERGAASSHAARATPASAPATSDDSGAFDPGTIAPSQAPPSTSTGTS